MTTSPPGEPEDTGIDELTESEEIATLKARYRPPRLPVGLFLVYAATGGAVLGVVAVAVFQLGSPWRTDSAAPTVTRTRTASLSPTQAPTTATPSTATATTTKTATAHDGRTHPSTRQQGTVPPPTENAGPSRRQRPPSATQPPGRPPNGAPPEAAPSQSSVPPTSRPTTTPSSSSPAQRCLVRVGELVRLVCDEGHVGR